MADTIMTNAIKAAITEYLQKNNRGFKTFKILDIKYNRFDSTKQYNCYNVLVRHKSVGRFDISAFTFLLTPGLGTIVWHNGYATTFEFPNGIIITNRTIEFTDTPENEVKCWLHLVEQRMSREMAKENSQRTLEVTA